MASQDPPGVQTRFPFQPQKRFLSSGTPAIASETARGRHHPVAGHDEGEGIPGHRPPDGPRGTPGAHLSRQFPIGDRFTRRYRGNGPADRSQKRGFGLREPKLLQDLRRDTLPGRRARFRRIFDGHADKEPLVAVKTDPDLSETGSNPPLLLPEQILIFHG